MIAPMTKYSFILLSGMQDSLMDTLQETGLVDISRSSKPVDDHSRELVAEIELLDGLIKGLQKAEVPEGTEPEYIDGDIERLAGGMLMRYSDDAVEMDASVNRSTSSRSGAISTLISSKSWIRPACPSTSTPSPPSSSSPIGPMNTLFP